MEARHHIARDHRPDNRTFRGDAISPFRPFDGQAVNPDIASRQFDGVEDRRAVAGGFPNDIAAVRAAGLSQRNVAVVALCSRKTSPGSAMTSSAAAMP